MSIMLANFGKYAISDCPFILYVHDGRQLMPLFYGPLPLCIIQDTIHKQFKALIIKILLRFVLSLLKKIKVRSQFCTCNKS